MNDYKAFLARLERSLAEGDLRHVRANVERLQAAEKTLRVRKDELAADHARAVRLLNAAGG